MRVGTVISGVRARWMLPIVALGASISVAPRAADAALIDIFLIADHSTPFESTTAPLSVQTTSVYRLDALNGNKNATTVNLVDNFAFGVDAPLTFNNLQGPPGRPIDEGEPGAGTADLVNSEVGLWDDVGIAGNGGLEANLNFGREPSVVFNSVAGGFTDLILAESGALNPFALEICPDATCATRERLFAGFNSGVLNTLLGSGLFSLEESEDASKMDQVFLFRFSEAIFDYVRVTEFDDRNVYIGDRLAVDFIGVGGSAPVSPIPGPAGLPLLAGGLALLIWPHRQKRA